MKTLRSRALLTALILIAVTLAFSVPPARAAGTLYVKSEAAGLGDCSSWDNACTLQTALGQATSGDEIWVMQGRHTPASGADRSATFQLRNGIAIYGGFAGTEQARDARNFTANATLLSGEIGSEGPEDNSYHVVTGSGTDGTAVLDGFTVERGSANGGATDTNGAGMFNEGGSPRLTNIIFTGNAATDNGGGMYNSSSSPTLTNVTFSGNSATSGGGVFNQSSNAALTNATFAGNSAVYGGGMFNYSGSNATLTNVSFSGNNATERGGGMYNSSSSPALSNVWLSGNTAYLAGGVINEDSGGALTNVTFSGNHADSWGGGMFNLSSSPTLTNVTFAGNSANDTGGGIYNGSGSNATLTNVTIAGNQASNAGGGLCSETSSPTMVRNSILWGNTASDGPQVRDPDSSTSITYSVVQGGYAGAGNLSLDPLLAPLGDYGGSAPTLALLPGSAAIDAGDDATCAASDQRGANRHGSHCDMGAFESRGFTLAITGGDNQWTLVSTAFATPLAVRVSSAYGEPVDGGMITFEAPEAGASAQPASERVAIAGGVAAHSLTANDITGAYAVTAEVAGAIAPATFALSNRVSTTTSLTASANPVVWGQPVTLTVTVDGDEPSGTVTFSTSGAAIEGCQDLALANGQASCATTPAAVGAHSIGVTYSGDAHNSPSSATLTLDVNPANTTAVIMTSVNPSLGGYPVTVSVTVSAVAPGAGMPTGSVVLYETIAPGVTAPQALAAQPLVNGVATFPALSLAPGTHYLLAQYSGDGQFEPTTSPVYSQAVHAHRLYLPGIFTQP